MDLSTGISPFPYPLGAIPASAFARLPGRAQEEALREAAARAYGAPDASHVLPAPGTQILLPLIASLIAPGRAAILSPTYAEHAHAARLAGHEVIETQDVDALAESELAVVVNPNNPDGRVTKRDILLELATRMQRNGGLLVVDEAFGDVAPDESLDRDVECDNIVVLRSFGKFHGLAGLRLGFALASRGLVQRLRRSLGPWAVNGPALFVGTKALEDHEWRQETKRRLRDEARQLDRLLLGHGLMIAGGTDLFRLVRAPVATQLHRFLGTEGILVRSFEWDAQLLRFGLPGSGEERGRLERALGRFRP